MITIAELRARNNRMTQKELADEIGVYQETVSRWEKDISRINSVHLKRLCLFFDVSADDLLGIEKKEKNLTAIWF